MYHTALVLAVTICCVNAAITVNVYDAGLQSNNEVEDKDIESCEDQFCNTLCQYLGLGDGSCVSGQCKCEKSNFQSEDAVNNEGSCDYRACDQLCRRLGFPGGACVGDRCQCDNFLEAQDSLETNPELERCNKEECNSLCRKIGYNGGFCLNDRCKCDNLMEFTNALVAGLGSCSLLECEQRCRRIGFPGGACVNDRCKCDILQTGDENEIPVFGEIKPKKDILRAEVEPEVNEIPAIGQIKLKKDILRAEVEPEVSRRSSALRGGCDCVPRSCDTYCFRIHYTGGICVDGTCRCYK